MLLKNQTLTSIKSKVVFLTYLPPNISQNLLVAQTSVEAQKMSNILKLIHNKFQILTQTNKLLLFLTYFRRYTSSDSHFILMMSYDVTGGCLMEAPIVELSVPALK